MKNQQKDFTVKWPQTSKNTKHEQHHKIYLCEPEFEQQFFALSVPVKAMAEANSDMTVYNLVDAVRIALLAYKTKQGKIDNVAGLLALYVKKTETYKVAMQHLSGDTSMHILINVYGRIGHESAALRPAVIGCEGKLKTFEAISSISKEMLEYDKSENPDFFSTI